MLSFCFTRFTNIVCFLPFTERLAEVGNNACYEKIKTQFTPFFIFTLKPHISVTEVTYDFIIRLIDPVVVPKKNSIKEGILRGNAKGDASIFLFLDTYRKNYQ